MLCVFSFRDRGVPRRIDTTQIVSRVTVTQSTAGEFHRYMDGHKGHVAARWLASGLA